MRPELIDPSVSVGDHPIGIMPSGACAELSVQTVTTEEEFAELRQPWNALAAVQPETHPFLRHEWFSSWWKAFGVEARLAIRVARRGNQVVGIAPMAERRIAYCGFRVWGLASLTNDHSNRFALLIAPGPLAEQGAVVDALWNEVLEQPAWDVVLLQACPQESLSIKLVAEAAARRGYGREIWEGPRSPYLILSPDGPAIVDACKAHRRSDLRRRRQQLERAYGPLRLEQVREPEHVVQALSRVFEIEAAGWKGARETAMASDDATRRFYTEIACHAAAQGTLSIDFLTVGRRRIAFGYHLLSGSTWYLLKTGYDPAFARFGPGMLFLSELFQRLQAEGPIEYDFLGSDDAYKLEWTRSVRRHRWWYFFPPRLTSRVLRRLKFEWVPWTRRVIRGRPEFSPRGTA